MAEPMKTVKLKSSDGVEIVVSESVAKQSEKIRQIIEAAGAENSIPLTDITAKTLEKVVEYCSRRVEAAQSMGVLSEEELKKWDQQFLEVDPDTLYDLMMAAYHLDIGTLTDEACKKVADRMAGKTVKEMRQILRIQNDYTPEQEAALMREHSWAFE